MNDNTAEEIKKLFQENEEFRKELITNTKSTLEKYGIDIGDETLIEFKQAGRSGEVTPQRCVVQGGFLICEF